MSACVRLDKRVCPPLECRGIQCAFQDASFTRVSIAIQFTSQLLPPSSENACSKRHESEVISETTNRTRMALPSRLSWAKNSPRLFLNTPIVGGLKVPPNRLEKLRLHWREPGLYRRRDRPSMRPAVPLASSSTRLARPFHTLRTTVVPSYPTHLVEPLSGCRRRDKRVFQVPRWKSKSRCPSLHAGCLSSASDRFGFRARARVHDRRSGTHPLSVFMNLSSRAVPDSGQASGRRQ